MDAAPLNGRGILKLVCRVKVIGERNLIESLAFYNFPWVHEENIPKDRP